jgi:hypothetical protein
MKSEASFGFNTKISNDALSRLITANVIALENVLEQHDFVELSTTAITIHA